MSLRLWDGHLYGDPPIGIYNLLPDSTTWWSATDIDVDRIDWVQNLMEVWSYYGLRTYAETSRSKGWHLWLFHAEPIPASTARDAWLWVHEVADVPATEVYPKQVDGSTTFGNCIRMPYPKGRNPGRQVVFEDDFSTILTPQELCDAVATEIRSPGQSDYGPRKRPTEATLAGVAANLEAPEVQLDSEVAVEYRRGGSGQDIHQVYVGNADVPNGQRDNSFWVLACYAAGKGHSATEIEAIIHRVWRDQTPDKSDFQITQALNKVQRAWDLVSRKKNT